MVILLLTEAMVGGSNPTTNLTYTLSEGSHWLSVIPVVRAQGRSGLLVRKDDDIMSR